MKHLLTAEEEWGKILNHSHLLLFMDYDGTLAPIVDSPEEAILPPEMKRMLENLTQIDWIKTTIVTGRSLNQVKEFIGLRDLIYVGSHGLEIEGPNIHYLHSGALETKNLMRTLGTRLKNTFDQNSGIVVEEKSYTVSIHYRHVKDNELEQNRLRLMRVIFPYLEKSQIVLSHAKKVWELRPDVEWNKASAMLWLSGNFSASLQHRSVVSMYIGDDKPDEACFKIIRNGGLGVRVTENPSEPTYAEYYLRNTGELHQFISMIQSKRSNRS